MFRLLLSLMKEDHCCIPAHYMPGIEGEGRTCARLSETTLASVALRWASSNRALITRKARTLFLKGGKDNKQPCSLLVRLYHKSHAVKGKISKYTLMQFYPQCSYS